MQPENQNQQTPVQTQPQPTQPVAPQQQTQAPPQESGWNFRQESTPTQQSQQGPAPQELPAQQQTQSETVSWTASEYMSHHRDTQWYLLVFGGLGALCTVIFLATRDIVSIITIVVAFILFLVISAKKPNQQNFSIDGYGVNIGSKFYPYDTFKSFAMFNEGAIRSINFMPLKRLMPEISIYYAPEDEARIIDVLASRLPNEQKREQGLDKVIRRLRF